MNTSDLIKAALQEDLPNGDITTDPLEVKDQKGTAALLAKQDLVLSGTAVFQETFLSVDSSIALDWLHKDGAVVSKGTSLCYLKGPLASLLKGERTALNFLGHLSGVATLTRRFVEKTKGTETKIVDTRKTLPGLRLLEKKAVVDGGGYNHRLSLSDQVLIKENHIRTAGSIALAVERIRRFFPQKPIEVEVTNKEELREALACKVEKVLLDNMSLEEMAEAMRLLQGRCLVEASGNMTLERIGAVAQLGVDFISVGQLTHSAPCADLSLLFNISKPKEEK